MPKLTEKQQKNIKRIQEVMAMGDLAIAKMLIELEDRLEAEIPQIKNIIERIKGDKGEDGNNYEISKKDYKEIARDTLDLIKYDEIALQTLDLIDLDKIISITKDEVQKGIRIPKDGKDAEVDYDYLTDLIDVKVKDDVDSKFSSVKIPTKEEVVDSAEDIRNKLELLDGDERLKIEAIRDLREELDELKKIKTSVVSGGGVSNLRIAQSFKYIAHTEQPSGDIDGANTTYTVANDIWWVAGFTLNGEQIAELPNFTYSGKTITFSSAIPAAYSGKDFEIKYIGI